MEYWDIYDFNRIKTGKTVRRGKLFGSDEFHIVINVCIFNSENQMLIQQRQSYKSGWPDLWDLSVSGNALSGETSQDAAEREIREELGLAVDLKGVRPRLTLNYDEGFDDVFLLFRELELSDLVLQTEEVKAVRWARKDEILRMIESGEFIPYFPHVIGLLFDMRRGYGYLKQ